MTGKTERVVVTGMGVASPLGCNVTEFWDALVAGKSGVISLKSSIFSDVPTKVGGVVQGYEEGAHFNSKDLKRMSRSSQLALVATEQAIVQAKLHNGNVNREEVGVKVGSCIGGYSAADPQFRHFYAYDRMSPYTIPSSMNIAP